MTHVPITRPSNGPWVVLGFSVLVAALTPVFGVLALAATAVYAHRCGHHLCRNLALTLLIACFALLVLFSGGGGTVSGGSFGT